MAIARIYFLPKNTSELYSVDKIQIVEHSSNWLSLDDFVSTGYISTRNLDNIGLCNQCWVKIKAIGGYKINACYQTNSGGTSHYTDYDVDSNGVVTVYPWNTGSASIMNNYLYITVAEDTSTYHVTQDLTNCTSDALTDYDGGTQATITLTCNTGYKFDEVPALTMGSNVYSFTISEDRTTATVTITVSDDVWIIAAGTSYKPLTLDLEHVTSNITGEVKQGVNTFILTSESGYIFHDNVTLYDAGTAITDVYNDFSEGNTKCIFTHDVSGAITIEARAIKQVQQISSFANLYRVDNDILDELAKKRFYKFGQTTESVDYGQYITSLYILPYALDESMIADTAHIQLGDYDSLVDADLLKEYNFIVNMGRIEVPEKYHNVYDYLDCNCILHLPFTDEIQLDTAYVVNQVITLEFRIDLYSGEATVNVRTDKTDEVIASKSFSIGSQIPFMQIQTGNTINQLKQVLNNGIVTPYIEVIRSVPYNINTLFGRETVDYGKLENYTGFIKVTDIMLNISAKNEEKSEILTLLRNGVYINEK